MNMMKRTLAMLLALVMIVGVLPMSVLANEPVTDNFTGGTSTVVDAFVVMSDLHLGSANGTSDRPGLLKMS